MVLRILFIGLLLFGLCCPPSLPAADAGNGEKAVGEATAPTIPGLGELGARSAALTDFVVKSEERLLQLADLSKQEEALAGLVGQFKKILAEMETLGSPDDWYVDRLNQYINQFGQLRQGLNDLQQRLSSRQQEVDKIREQLRRDSDFWSVWEQDLKQQDVKLPKQTISQVQQQLERLNKALKTTTGQLLQQQEKLGAFQRELVQPNDQLIQALGNLRKATFRRNAYTFFTADFYRQFDSALTAQVGEGLANALKFDRRYLQDNGWLVGLLGGVFVFCTMLLRHYRGRLKVSDDWRFILNRPFAAAGFFSIALFWLLFPAPPALFRFVAGAVAVVTATALALSLLESRRQMQILILAAAIFLLTNLFRLISFPQPLFRLYISLLAIVIVPLLYRQIDHSRKLCASGQGRVFRALLRFSMVVLILSLFAQIFGYMNFSTWLIQATFETGVVFLFVRMAVLLLSGGIDMGNELLVQSESKFFQEYGTELSVRLKRLLKFILYGVSVFYLLPVWRLFATLNESWNYFSELAVEIGSFTLSAQMLGSALFAFYLAMQVSWVLQAVTETQVLRKRNADRGVQDAVKKLIHYAIVLIGFLLVLSLLGMGVQNFVVLLGAFGVGIGFGLQDIVNNFLSGLILLFERPIKVGDGVLIDGEYGTVVRIGMRSTVVQNLDEAELIVPNSQMISQKVTNWTLSNRRVRIVVPVGVAYGSDLEAVLAILTEAGNQHQEVLKLPKPTPLFIQFGASSLDFELRVWISNIDHRPRIKNELLLYIDRRFREAKIEIPFSQHDLHIRSVSPGILPAGTRDV